MHMHASDWYGLRVLAFVLSDGAPVGVDGVFRAAHIERQGKMEGRIPAAEDGRDQ